MAIDKTLWISQIEGQLHRVSDIIRTAQAYTAEQIVGGNSVTILSFDDAIDVKNYTKNTAMEIQNVAGGQIEMLIDKAKYFNIRVDDVQAVQGDKLALGEYTKKAALAMAEVVEDDIFALAVSSVDAGNVVDNALVEATVETITSYINKTHIKLDKVNAPGKPGDRVMIFDPETSGLLSEAGLLGTATTKTIDGFGSVQISTYGDRLEIITSTIVQPVAGVISLPMYVKNDYVKYLGQLENVREMSPTETFGKLVQGLIVYGTKVNNGKKGALLKIKEYAA